MLVFVVARVYVVVFLGLGVVWIGWVLLLGLAVYVGPFFRWRPPLPLCLADTHSALAYAYTHDRIDVPVRCQHSFGTEGSMRPRLAVNPTKHQHVGAPALHATTSSHQPCQH